jgi:hypothetical protein
MPPTESEMLAARLARMNTLIESLEQACSASTAQRDLFLKLKQEMEAAHAALKIDQPPGFSS